MKKKIIISAIVVIVAAASCFAYIKINYPYALYFGDRITGTYRSDIFYEEIEHSFGGIDADEISCIYGGENVRVETDDRNENFAIKGDEYGKYKIYFKLRRFDIEKCTSGQVELNDDFKICVSLIKNKNQIENLNVRTVFFNSGGEWYICVTAEDSDGMLAKQKTEKLDASNTEIELNLGP